MTRATVTLHIAAPGNHSYAAPVITRVTLPAPPWGEIDHDDRSATAPRTAPIRGASDWRRDPILRHADRRSDRG
jgi:hypothetical protein